MAGENSTQFQIDVAMGGQAAVESAAVSIEKLSQRLTDSGSAGEAAATGYARAAEVADRAAKAVEKIGVQADLQRGKLKAAMDVGDDRAAERAALSLQKLTAAENQAKTAAQAAKGVLAEQAAQHDKLHVSAAKAAAGLAETGEEGNGSARLIARGLNQVGGPLAELGARAAEFRHGWEGLKEALGDKAPMILAAVGIVAVIAAITELTIEVGKGIVEFGRWAVELADTRDTNEHLAAGIARSVAGGTKLNEKIGELANRVPIARKELTTMAETLAKTGLRGDKLSDALDKAAIKAAKLKFGPDFEAEMLSLDNQTTRFKSNLSGLFGGLKIDALLKGLALLINLFDESTASGKAIKVVFESLFQPLVDGAAGAAPKIERFFIQAEILALRALIAIKPYGSTILLIGKAFLIGVAIITGVVLGAFALLAVAIGAVVATVGALIYGFYTLATSISESGASAEKAVTGAFGSVRDAITGAIDFIKSISLAEIGTQLIQGLINGITGAGSALIASVKGVVTDAIAAAKNALGIHSPSTVFAEIGVQTGAGMQVGIESSTPGVQGALAGMTSSTTSTAPGNASSPGPQQAGGGKSGASLENVIFNFYGVKDAEQAKGDFSEMLTRILEGDAAQLGTQTPAPVAP